MVDRKPWILALLVTATVAAAFAGVLGNGFVYDDTTLVQGAADLDTLAPADHLARPFWAGGSTFGYYRPMTSWSLALDRAIQGPGPAGFHLTNLLLHLLTTLLVFRLLLRFASAELAAFCAGLFGLHPVQTEAVAWIVGRGDLLAVLFLVGAAGLHARKAGGRLTSLPLALGSGFLVFAGLLSKESAITFPALLLAVDVALAGTRGVRRAELPAVLWSRWRWIGPVHLVAVAGYLLLRHQAVGEWFGGADAGDELWKNPLVDTSPAVRWATALVIAARYCVILLFPRTLSVDYFAAVVPPVESLLEPRLVLSALLIAGIAFGLARAQRGDRLTRFGLIAGLGSYALVSHLFFAAPIVMAERALYLPMVGIAAILGSLAARAGDILKLDRRLRLGIALAILLLLAVRTGVRVRDWRDDLTLFRAAVLATPASSLSWNNLGAARLAAGDRSGALEAFDRAVALAPGNARAGLNAGRFRGMNGDLRGAEEVLRATVAQAPGQADLVWLELCQVMDLRGKELLRDGRREEAARLFLEAKQESRRHGADAATPDARATYTLIEARAAAALGHNDEAEIAFARALDASFDLDDADDGATPELRLIVLDEFGQFLLRTERPVQAIEFWDLGIEAAEIDGRRTTAARMLLQTGQAYGLLGRGVDARERLTRAIELADADPALLRRARAALERIPSEPAAN